MSEIVVREIMATQKSRRIKKIKNVIADLRQFEFKHHNMIFLIVSVILAYVLVNTPVVYRAIESIGGFGHIGSFVAGSLFTYGLTTAPATAALFILGKTLQNPFLVALVGAAGAVVSDYLIFRFVRGRLIEEIEETEKEILGRKIRIKIDPKGFAAKFIPVIAGLIIASPLPDEFGVAVFGAAKIRTRKFLQYAFFFNFIGIFIIASLGVAS